MLLAMVQTCQCTTRGLYQYGEAVIVRTADPPAGGPWIGTLEGLVPMTGS